MKIMIPVLWLLFFKLGYAQALTDSLSLSAHQLAEHLEKDSGMIIDVRTPQEYRLGHLKNSVMIDFLNSDFTEKIQALDKESTYYVYCRSGNRSSKAVALMREQGFHRVCNIKDGFEKLKQSGLPAE